MKKSNFKKGCCKTSGGNLQKSAGKKNNKKSEWFSDEIKNKQCRFRRASN